MKTNQEISEEIFQLCAAEADPYLASEVAMMVSAPTLVLNHLEREKDGVTLGELAKAASVAPSRITAILDDYEEKGWVERFSKEGDRLHIYAKLTPLGKKEAKRRKQTLLNWLEGLVEQVGQGPMMGFAKTLVSIARYVKKGEKGLC